MKKQAMEISEGDRIELDNGERITIESRTMHMDGTVTFTGTAGERIELKQSEEVIFLY
jgi:uncharacterized protein (AIM24 family)